MHSAELLFWEESGCPDKDVCISCGAEKDMLQQWA